MRRTAAFGGAWRQARAAPPSPVGEASDRRAHARSLHLHHRPAARQPAPREASPLPGVSYHVFVQQGDEASDLALGRLARRPDIRVRRVEGRGVARSRNAALGGRRQRHRALRRRRRRAPLRELRDAPASSSPATRRLSCVCGMTLDEAGRPRKRFGRHMSALRLWNMAKVGTPEIAVRRTHVVAGASASTSGSAPGRSWPIGDEYIFLADLLRKKLSGRHVALPLAIHPRLSSGHGLRRGEPRDPPSGVSPGRRTAVVPVPRGLRAQELDAVPIGPCGLEFPADWMLGRRPSR